MPLFNDADESVQRVAASTDRSESDDDRSAKARGVDGFAMSSSSTLGAGCSARRTAEGPATLNDGAPAAEFLSTVVELLSEPYRLLV